MEHEFSGHGKIAMLCIGDELLKGDTVNTNLAFAGETLLTHGVFLAFSAEIRDAEHDLLAALDTAFEHASVVITSGGLGPTADDVTREYIARYLGFRLEENGEATLNIKRYWKKRHASEEIPFRIFNQALVPVGSTVLQNTYGTAPGLILKTKSDWKYPDRTVILLPGPPSEFRPMFERQALPELLKLVPSELIARVFRICGPGEASIEDRMVSTLHTHHELSVAYCASPELVKLFLLSPSHEAMASSIADVRRIFRNELLRDEAASLPEELLFLLREHKAMFATAESCTGGLVAKQMTDIPGSSDVFLGGVVSYSNSLKQRLLGVPENILRQFGAVSSQTAEAMVDGVCAATGADAAVSLTGIAGPDGGTPEKPVGLVYAGIRFREKRRVLELRLTGSREQIRARAAACALNALRLLLQETPC